MSPVDYQPVMGSSPPPPAPLPSAGRRRIDPKRSSRDRVLLLVVGAAGCVIAWLLIVVLIPAVAGLTIIPTTPLWIAMMVLLLWVGFAILTNIDEPFFARLAATGAFATGVWAVIAALLMLASVTPLIAGWVSIGLVWFVSLTLPVWVVEIEPGEVLYFRPITHRPYKYELVSCPVQRIEAVLQPNERGNLRPSGAVASIFQFMDSAASTHQVSQIELAIDYLWVRPVDELRLLWKMEKNIMVETQIRDIVTRDQSAFTLWLKVGATLDPTKIRGRNFLLQIPRIETPAKLEATMKGIIQDNVDKAAREYFIQRSSVEARGEAGVTGFRSQVATLLISLSDNLGLTFVESMINSTPVLSQEQRAAADRAAAAPEYARAELATTDALVERAMGGSAPHQLYLYTRIVEKGGQFRSVPAAEQMPQVNPVDQFLWRVSHNDAQSLELLRAMASAYPELPLPPALAPYVAVSAPPALAQPLAALPAPAPARLRPPDAPPPLEATQPMMPPVGAPPMPSGAIPEMPPVQPSNLPESPSQTSARPPATRLRPNIDIRGAIQTRQRPDGSYEPDFDDDDEDN